MTCSFPSPVTSPCPNLFMLLPLFPLSICTLTHSCLFSSDTFHVWLEAFHYLIFIFFHSYAHSSLSLFLRHFPCMTKAFHYFILIFIFFCSYPHSSFSLLPRHFPCMTSSFPSPVTLPCPGAVRWTSCCPALSPTKVRCQQRVLGQYEHFLLWALD